jgi:hypothetical protein
MDAPDQEKALTKLLIRSLRRSLQAGGADCPGVDILAAYADRSLSDTETARWESHFSTCARCQQVLAALAVSEIESLPVSETQAVEARGERIRTMPHRYLSWRWLAPAAAVAAAVALWIAMRPTPPFMPAATKAPEELARNLPPPAPGATSKEAAKTEVPSPAARAESSRAKARPAPFARSSAPTLEQKPAAGARLAGREAKAMSTNAGERETAGALGAPARPGETPAAAGAAVAPQASQRTEVGKLAQAQPGLAGSAAPAPAPLESKAKEPSEKARDTQAVAAARALRTQPADRLRRTIALEPTQVLIASPRLSVLWRVGSAGRIERSRDAGRTWQVQVSNVEVDLVAGSAPSETVCWVVGRAGTILRTADGEHWEKVPSPTRADWVGVEAQDALNATVFAGKNQRYSTTDGGRNWHAP